MKVPYVDLYTQHKKIKSELMDAVSSVIDDSNFILGRHLKQFEEELAGYCGTRFALGLNSGTDALFLSFKALGIGPGDEVILPPNTFLATASSIIAAGATPIFADILENQLIDPAEVEKKMTKKTKAIVPVHLTGKPADLDPILELAKQHQLYIIEDSAQAIGAEYKGKKVSSFGDIGCFSFHPVKTLNACGDGGAVVTNNEELYSKISQLRNIGLKNRNESELWGYNSRLDGFQSAILRVKLKYLEEWTQKREAHAALYCSLLSDDLILPTKEPHERHVYHTFIIQHPQRDALMSHLADHGIETKIHYPIPIHLQQVAKHLGYKRGDFPICEKVVSRMLSLPIYQDLTTDQIHYVAEAINSFLHAAVK